MASRVRKVLGNFEKRAPGHHSRAGSVWPETTLSSAELTRSFRRGLADLPGGGDSHTKRGGMLVVSLRGVDFGFWSDLGCYVQNAIICSREGLL